MLERARVTTERHRRVGRVAAEGTEGYLRLATGQPLVTLAGAVSVAKREVRLRTSTECVRDREKTWVPPWEVPKML